MAETITRQLREPFVESAGLGITNEGLRLLNQALPTSTYTGRGFVADQSALETGAQQAAAQLGNLVGTGAGTAQQEGSIASFMSPYQQDVIDASLTALQREQDKGLMSLRDSAVRSGAFGGGREAAFGDYTRLGLIGPQLASVIGGFPAATQVQSVPPPSTTQQLLGLGIGAAGLGGAVRSLIR
jgi:hypothetical protein